ncbi:polysaccharide lyase family 7 protein [Psychromonas sp. SP041]|uniref:polysaccharide lyase family 7 protein n=1 Tax=Psychromonas sp. SP041 TaxID=1365007 RepID=UPI0003F8C11D|nr:polysaccharide lyase family 7 protein [Psychromonas sp. SP041]
MLNKSTFATVNNKVFKLAALACSFVLLGCANTASDNAQSIQTKAGSPASQFDLLGWTISVPVDADGNGKSDQIKEKALAGGYSDENFFYLAQDSGMVFKSPVKGAKTSKNTKYTRSELREMMRRGNTSYNTKGVGGNNWVFSTAPTSDQEKAGGVDGTLEATLAVNHVTTTGVSWQQGRVIIGQIHANDDEPVRLYYRKLPNHQKGSIYFAHEPNSEADEQWVDIIGNSLPNYWNQDATPAEPEDGIELGEKFSYRIKVTGHELAVTIMRPGKADTTKTVDMSNSKYDVGGQYMYFKAGVYNQNKTGDAKDYVQATFYDLKVTH